MVEATCGADGDSIVCKSDDEVWRLFSAEGAPKAVKGSYLLRLTGLVMSKRSIAPDVEGAGSNDEADEE